MGGAPLDMKKVWAEMDKRKPRKLTEKERSERRVDMINRQHISDMKNLFRMGLR